MGKKKGDILELYTKPLNEIPIKECRDITKFVDIIDRIIDKRKKGNDTIDLEHQIDKMIYKLYDLTYEEVKIVDPETSITREEYEEKEKY